MSFLLYVFIIVTAHMATRGTHSLERIFHGQLLQDAYYTPLVLHGLIYHGLARNQQHKVFHIIETIILFPSALCLIHKIERKKMLGQVSYDVEVDVAASQAWKLYGTLQLAKIVQKGLSHMVEKIELIEGDGGVGTVLELTFVGGQGMPEHTTAKEKFTTIDHEKYIKEVEAIEGGFLNLGFNQYRVYFEIIEKGEDSCIIKSKIEYDVNEEAISIASIIPSLQLEAIAGVAKDYLLKMKNESAN